MCEVTNAKKKKKLKREPKRRGEREQKAQEKVFRIFAKKKLQISSQSGDERVENLLTQLK